MLKVNLPNPARFDFNEMPLNGPVTPIIVITGYLILIVAIEQYRKRFPASQNFINKVRSCQAYHNLALSITSAFMVVTQLLIMLGIELKLINNTEKYYVMCPVEKTVAKGPIGLILYIFYLTKYWELLDTILQMSKGSRPPSYYFHVWHHTVYLMICWAYCRYNVSLSPASPIVNGGVHVIMYYYFYCCARKLPVPWKHLITKTQIVQFIAGYAYFLMALKKKFIDKLDCNGLPTLFIHASFNFTMLVGFIKIYNRIINEKMNSKKIKAQ